MKVLLGKEHHDEGFSGSVHEVSAQKWALMLPFPRQVLLAQVPALRHGVLSRPLPGTKISKSQGV